MFSFKRKILLFILPLVLAIYIFLGRYIYAGIITCELLPFDIALNSQLLHPDVLIGMGYNEETSYYKMKMANRNKAPVIALGTSRVMQFSSRYFKEGCFYNCGGGASNNYDEYLNFLKNLEYSPKVILLGLDFWLFNENFISLHPEFPSKVPINTSGREFNDIFKQLISDYHANKWSFEDLENYPREIGFNGRIKQSGFLIDGMYYYGDTYRYPDKAVDFKFKDTLERIESGTRRFQFGDTIYDKTVEELDELLSYCRDEGIYVIGFLPPVAPTVYKAMMNSGKYQYVNLIPKASNSVFSSYHYPFYDFLDMEEYGFKDDGYIDGFHGSQVVYAGIIKQLCVDDERLETYIDEEMLNYLLKNRFSNILFDPMAD